MIDPEARPWWEAVAHLREDATRDRAAGPGNADAAANANADAAANANAADANAPASRRTVVIRGHTIPSVPARRLVEVADRRRAPRNGVERVVARPDRMALWAVFFGLLLIVIAATSAHP